MRVFKKVIFVLVVLILSTGCVKRDNIDDINIVVTSYPIEYLVEQIYGYNSHIDSIYPNGTNINTYTLTDKQKKEYSSNDMFVYNGIFTNEKSLTAELINKNKYLKLIDVSKGLSITSNSQEELWLYPSNYLMLAQNIKTDLLSYANSTVLKQEINDNYDALKLTISTYDAEIKLTAKNASNKNIIVGNAALNFLSKYGFDVYCVEENDDYQQKTYQEARNLITNKKNKYVYILDTDEVSENVQKLVDSGATIIKVNSMDTLTEQNRLDNVDYSTLMDQFIENIKKEAYN